MIVNWDHLPKDRGENKNICNHHLVWNMPKLFKMFHFRLFFVSDVVQSGEIAWLIKILLMEEILHQLIGSLSHFLQGFNRF